ncbi:MAG: hypothetical protein ABIH92_00820 [Nanoarchaeota archaeon]
MRRRLWPLILALVLGCQTQMPRPRAGLERAVEEGQEAHVAIPIAIPADEVRFWNYAFEPEAFDTVSLVWTELDRRVGSEGYAELARQMDVDSDQRVSQREVESHLSGVLENRFESIQLGDYVFTGTAFGLTHRYILREFGDRTAAYYDGFGELADRDGDCVITLEETIGQLKRERLMVYDFPFERVVKHHMAKKLRERGD